MKTAVLLGAGGLGCPAALALRDEARARGVALRVLLVDDDRVDRSNLSRQILFTEADVGRFKAEVAAEKLSAAPSAEKPSALLPARLPALAAGDFSAVARVERFDRSTAEGLLRGADVLLDGTDSFTTRFCANDLAVARGLPLVHGAALGWVGHLLTVLPGKTGCLRCLFEGPPPEGSVPACAEAGVLSPLCGLVGAAMARAAMQVLLGAPEAGVLLRWDALRGAERPLPLERDPDCAACARVAS